MKFQVGDKVLLIHSNEEGEVLDIINEQMVLVNVDGISFPAYIDQIDFPYYKRFTEKTVPATPVVKKYVDDIKKEKQVNISQAESGVWLTFLPVILVDELGDEVVKELKLHLLNQTKEDYNFIYTLHFFGKPDFELKNELHPFENFYLHDIPFEAMNDSPAFEFNFSLKKPEKDRVEYYETSYRLKPKLLFTKLNELKEKNEASFSFRLFGQYPFKTLEEELYLPQTKKERIFELSKIKQQLEPLHSIIDLHIEKLTDDWKRFSNFEILTFQLQAFEKYYDLSVLHRQPSLIVIHGVGSGRLKDEIHSILKHKTEVKSFVNQYHPLYGFGATEITFQY